MSSPLKKCSPAVCGETLALVAFHRAGLRVVSLVVSTHGVCQRAAVLLMLLFLNAYLSLKSRLEADLL